MTTANTAQAARQYRRRDCIDPPSLDPNKQRKGHYTHRGSGRSSTCRRAERPLAVSGLHQRAESGLYGRKSFSQVPYNVPTWPMRNTLPRAVLIDVVAGAAVFVGSGALHAPSIIPCFDETFQMVVLAYMALIVMSLTLLSQIGPVSFGWLCASLAAFCAIGLWLGAYHISPSRFGRGGPPIISGFRVTRSERKLVTAEPGREVDIAANSAIETEPISVAGADPPPSWARVDRPWRSKLTGSRFHRISA